MKLASFGAIGREGAGVVDGDRILDLGKVRPAWPTTWGAILRAGLWPEVSAAVEVARTSPSASTALAGERLGPPITDPSKIIAIGLNYRDHALEQGKEPPPAPLLFAKAPSSLIGPRDPIVLPIDEPQVDAEAELAVAIGTRARDVTEAAALDFVLGYTIMNDVSGRAAQYGDKQWFRGKSFDTFAPCGPWLVTADEYGDPIGRALEADWSDRAMQRGNTRDLLFDIRALVAYVSRQMTLLPGDLISTGTPAGVGVFRTPPVFLRSGDVVRIRLDGIGELQNPVQ